MKTNPLLQHPARSGPIECHPEPAKDPLLVANIGVADPSSPALREASLRAECTGLPCAKRACERSPWVPPQDDSSSLIGHEVSRTHQLVFVFSLEIGHRIGQGRLEALAIGERAVEGGLVDLALELV